jgi:hypothetical protein
MEWTALGTICVGPAKADHVKIDVVRWESDQWRVANVEVVAGIWKGVFRWQFYNGELRGVGQQILELHRTLVGAAILEPMEPNLILKMTGDGKGHIAVEGRAEPEFSAGTYLIFSVALDQTELPALAAALSAADPA